MVLYFSGKDMDVDTSIVDESLQQEILALIFDNTTSTICQKLTSIWKDLWSEDEQIKRKGVLAKECQAELKEFLEEVLKSEEKVKEDYITRIEGLLNEMNELQTTLGVKIPYEDVETLPLHIMAAKLNKKAEKYRTIKNQLTSKLDELNGKEIALCEKLGMLKCEIDSSNNNTKSRIKLLENHIIAMELEKVKRTNIFIEQREIIKQLYQELGSQPRFNFEKEVLSEEAVENFALTNENMTKLNELRSQLEAQLESAKEKVKECVNKLTLLWNYLGELKEYQEEFLSKHEGCSVNVIKNYESELSRCEAKKRENISGIIQNIRKVLIEEWDKCLISTEEREKFHPYYSTCFNEDLCDLHELEIARLQKFYSDNEQIYLLIKKHEVFFNKLLNLENGSKNANRYYNRGGQLLQEEKERKLITKELPLVEEELRSLLKKFEEDNKRPFTSFGVPLETILDKQWSSHFDQKTIDKLTKRKGDKKFRTPLGKRVCTTPYTPSTPNKVSRLNFDGVQSINKNTTPMTTVKGVALRSKKLKDEHNTSIPSYDDFQVLKVLICVFMLNLFIIFS